MRRKSNLSPLYRSVAVFFVIVAVLFAYELASDNFDVGGSVDYGKHVLYVDFIDVGQGDSILIRTAESAVLIDAGTSSSRDDIIDFLDEKDVERLDLFVLTHPHADHIGGAAAVLDAVQVDKILMPDAISTSKTYENLIDKIEKLQISVELSSVGKKYVFGEARLTVLAPIGEFDDLNNASVVLHLAYGESTFLFTGDAEAVSEERIIQSGADIDVDVLKVGHHGSNTSSSLEFLNKTTPIYAIISVGEGNSYGHPANSTLERLENLGITVLRTDILSDITLVSDGENIEEVK